jgi:hypothetical protein
MDSMNTTSNDSKPVGLTVKTLNVMRSDDGRRFNRLKWSSMEVYVETNVLYDRLDQWFQDNTIGHLATKSRAWRRVSRVAERIIARHIAQHFGADPKTVKWSRKCGCACGCSPGFRIYDAPTAYRHRTAWIQFVPSDAEVAELEYAICFDKTTHRLLAADRVADAAERVKQEEERVKREQESIAQAAYWEQQKRERLEREQRWKAEQEAQLYAAGI